MHLQHGRHHHCDGNFYGILLSSVFSFSINLCLKKEFMKEYICYFPVWTGGLTQSFPLKFGSLEKPNTKFSCPRIVHNWSGIHRDEKRGGKVEESFDLENLTRFELLFSFCRTGRVFISDEDLKPERSVSVHRSNSFLCLNSSSAMWITNRMLFDHPLYGLNVDRVLGFHDYTLGQVTCNTLGHTLFWQTIKNVNVSTEVTCCSCVSFKSHFVVYMKCFFFFKWRKPQRHIRSPAWV